MQIKCFFFFFLLSFELTAQSPADNWFFGDKVGLQFLQNGPQLNLQGKLHTFEGVAAISDQNGNLLFYTEGDTVWNRLHQVMPNGTGLLGDASSTQSAVICEFPEMDSTYFVFTIGQGSNANFMYSIVDLALENGLGDIDSNQKNILIRDSVCEKITAVEKCDKSGFWVLVRHRGSRRVFAYSLDTNGFDTNAIVSNALLETLPNSGGAFGYMKSSPDGAFIAMCHEYQNTLELCKFNAQTGTIISSIILPVEQPTNSLLPFGRPYGLEFSPNSKLLYITPRNANPKYSYIYQYALESFDSLDISLSKFEVTDSLGAGCLQLGPDQKIYGNDLKHMNVIPYPNEIGANCGYQWKAIDLNGRNPFTGLPNFIVSDFYYPIQSAEVCVSDSVEFHFQDSCANNFTWNFGDTASGSSNTSSLSDPVHVFSNTGAYTVTLVVNYPTQSDTFQNSISVNRPPIPNQLGDTIFFCKGDSVKLSLSDFSSHFIWSTGQDSSSIHVNSDGWYFVTIENSCGILSDSVLLTSLDSLNLNLGADTSICSNQSISIHHNLVGQGTSFLWWNGDSLDVIQNVHFLGESEQAVWLQASNACNSVADSITIRFILPPKMDWFNDSLLCHRLSPSITLPTSDSIVYFLTYAAESSEDTLNYPWLIQQSGFYTLVAITACDTVSKSSYLSPNQIITTELATDTSYCLGQRVVLNAFSNGSTYLWSSGSTDSAIVIDQSGLYEVTVTNTPCTHSFFSNVNFSPDACNYGLCKFDIPNVFTPNADGVNDQLIITNACAYLGYKAFIYNRWGQLMWFSSRDSAMPSLRWDGYVNGTAAAEGVYFVEVEYVNITGEINVHKAAISLLR